MKSPNQGERQRERKKESKKGLNRTYCNLLAINYKCKRLKKTEILNAFGQAREVVRLTDAGIAFARRHLREQEIVDELITTARAVWMNN